MKNLCILKGFKFFSEKKKLPIVWQVYIISCLIVGNYSRYLIIFSILANFRIDWCRRRYICRAKLSSWIIVNHRWQEKNLAEAVAPYRRFDPRGESVYWNIIDVPLARYRARILDRCINEIYNYERIITTEWRFAQGDNHALRRRPQSKIVAASSRNIAISTFSSLNRSILFLCVSRVNYFISFIDFSYN